MAQLYTCAEAAERYSVQVITVWDWIRKKKLKAVRIGRDYRISEEDLIELKNDRKTVH